MLQRVPQLRKAIEYTQAFRAEEAKKEKGKMVNTSSSFSFKDNGLSEKAFAVSGLSTASVVGFKTKNIYQNMIKNGGIFNIRFNIYIYNSLKGFTKTRNGDKIIKVGATSLIIQIYSQVTINIISLNGMKPLVLYNIAYILKFFLLTSFLRSERNRLTYILI